MTIKQINEGKKYQHIDGGSIAEVWSVQPAKNGVMEVWFFSIILDCRTDKIGELDRMTAAEFSEKFKEINN